MTLMRAHATALYAMDATRLRSEPACAIWKIVTELFPPAVRTLCLLFERDKRNATSGPGRRWLRTMIEIAPDNETVEDLHKILGACLGAQGAKYPANSPGPWPARTLACWRNVA